MAQPAAGSGSGMGPVSVAPEQGTGGSPPAQTLWHPLGPQSIPPGLAKHPALVLSGRGWHIAVDPAEVAPRRAVPLQLAIDRESPASSTDPQRIRRAPL